MITDEIASTVVKRRVRWNGPPPRAGDYLLSTAHVGRAYRLVTVERVDNLVRWNGTRKTESRLLAITIEGVTLEKIPEAARKHPWRCDESEPLKEDVE